MEEELREILKKIAEMRDKLYMISETRGLSHPDLVEISQQMDELLNEYQRLNQKHKRW